MNNQNNVANDVTKSFGLVPKKTVVISDDDFMTLNFKIRVRKEWGAEWHRVVDLLKHHYEGGGTTIVHNWMVEKFDDMRDTAEALPKVAKKVSKKKGGAL